MVAKQSYETERLAELIGCKHDILIHLRRLTMRQAEFVGAGDLSSLHRIFAAKQSLLNQLQRVESQLDPFRTQDPSQRRWRTPEDRRRCREMSDRCAVLLEEIKQAECNDQQTLVRRRDEVASQLEVANTGVHACSAYLTNDTAARRQLDITSEQ